MCSNDNNITEWISKINLAFSDNSIIINNAYNLVCDKYLWNKQANNFINLIETGNSIVEKM